ELPEAEFLKALEFAHGHAREMIRAQKELAAQAGKPKRDMPLLNVKPELLEIAYQVAGDRIEGALYAQGKVGRSKAVQALREEVKAAMLQKYPEADEFAISQAFDYVQKKAFRVSVLEKQKRMDGRGYQDLRQISCEVGHGALAERSLEPVVPSENDFRYAIRISSEVMESNGSTSMASVCGGMLALMDAGVPVKDVVAGISVGLVTEYDNDQLKRYEL